MRSDDQTPSAVRRHLRYLGSILLVTALIGCSQGSVGDETIKRCVPDGACDEAMFQGGLKGSPANPLAGSQLYTANCASCHGPDGRGMKTTERVNFTDPVWHARFEDREIAEIILRGRPPMMPALSLNEGQLRDVIGHIRGLKEGEAPPSEPAPPVQGY